MNKLINYNMKQVILTMLLICFGALVYAQSITYFHRDIQRIGNVFESTLFGDNQTVLVPIKGTAEMDIQHRFGVVDGGYSTLFGFYAPSNIRLGLSYVPINNLMIGGGITKERLLWDLNIKYAFLDETGDDPDPISLTYYANMAVDTRADSTNKFFAKQTDRMSYFHQIMVAKKFTRDFSAQLGFSYTHFNSVEGYINDDNETVADLNNDHFAASVMARYKISDAFAFMADINYPLTQHDSEKYVNPNFCIGFEIATPMHSFQMFAGNYRWMVPSYNNLYSEYNYQDGLEGFLLGFNITRLLDAQEESLYDMILKRHPKKEGGAH